MCGKCYTHITEILKKKVTKEIDVWRPIMWNGRNYFLLAKHSSIEIQFGPLYVHSCNYIQPPKATKANKIVSQFESLKEANTVADKLRWLRLNNGLLQKEVASYANISRKVYNGYERIGVRDYYPIDDMVKIAELYNVDVELLLDDYNLFLYRGQVEQIKSFRKARQMTQSQYASFLGVAFSVVHRWEQRDFARITKASWALLMEKEQNNVL